MTLEDVLPADDENLYDSPDEEEITLVGGGRKAVIVKAAALPEDVPLHSGLDAVLADLQGE